MTEQEFDVVRDRYHDLSDLANQRKLTDAEQVECEALGVKIDAYFEPFYAPIIAELEGRLKAVSEAEE